MSVTSMPKVIHYDTLDSFDAIDGLHLSLVKDGAYERVFSVNAGHEDLAKVIGQGMTLALSIARAEWDNPVAAPTPQLMGVVIPFPKRPPKD